MEHLYIHTYIQLNFFTQFSTIIFDENSRNDRPLSMVERRISGRRCGRKGGKQMRDVYIVGNGNDLAVDAP